MQVPTVDPAMLRQWLAQRSALLVDVREAGEHRAQRIADAHHIPLAKIDAAQLPNSHGAVVIHCLKGGRGASACEKLMKQNPELEVYNLAGGIDAWAAAGLPVIREKGFDLPLDRQVQLSIGLCLLAAAGLTYFASPIFVLAVAILGTGLTIAGITGFCGLARVMARAPWNRRQDLQPRRDTA